MKIGRNRTRLLDFLVPFYEGRRIPSYFDEDVTKPLEHIAGHWELSWDDNKDQFLEEPGSFSPLINLLIDVLSKTPAYRNYHRFMDEELLASKFYKEVIDIQNKEWVDSETGDRLRPESLGWFLEQSSSPGWPHKNLLISISSRIRAAQRAGVANWDELDVGHKTVLAELFKVVLYVQSSNPLPNGYYVWNHSWADE